MFRLQHSTKRICAAIGDIGTIQCMLYYKVGAKYCAHSPVFAMWTVILDIYNAFTAPHIQCFNIQLNVSALQFEISRQFNERNTANLEPNIAHILQFSLCEQWSRKYTMHLQLRMLSASIFNWTYLRCNWRYHDNSMRVILKTWCEVQRTPSSFRYVNSGPAHIQSIYSSAYICFNIRWNVSALLLAIIGHFEARYTANWEPTIAHIIRFTTCGLWSRTYTM
jgi:hypothetical protein